MENSYWRRRGNESLQNLPRSPSQGSTRQGRTPEVPHFPSRGSTSETPPSTLRIGFPMLGCLKVLRMKGWILTRLPEFVLQVFTTQISAYGKVAAHISAPFEGKAQGEGIRFFGPDMPGVRRGVLFQAAQLSRERLFPRSPL